MLPDDTLRLDLSVENTGDTDVVDPLVTLGVQQEVPRNRGALLGWFDAEAPPRARTEWQSPVPATIPAGTTQSLVLEIPMTDLDFPVRFDNWGARGLEVTLTSGDGTTGRARTSGLFYPDEFEATPLDVAVLVPAVADAEEWRESVDAAAALAIERAPQPEELAPPAAVERAATLLGTGADVALDPALARVLPSSGPDAPTNGEGTVLALPWADADVAALPLDDDGKRLLTDALTRGTSDFAAAPIAASGTVLWPAGSALTLDALIALSRLDADGVVLETPLPDERPRVALTSPATTARIDVETGARTVEAVAGDPVLGALLVGELGRVGLTGTFVDRVDPGVLADQLALAYTAVVAREQAEPVDLLASVTREDAWTLDAARTAALDRRIVALDAQPWVNLTDVPALLDEPATSTVDPDDLLDIGVLRNSSPMTIPRRTVLSQVTTLTQDASALASAFPDGTGLDGLDPLLDVAGSAAWRLADEDGSAVTGAVADELASVYRAVTVTVPSSVNLAANDGAIPVTLTNELSVPITARLEARPEQLLLRVDRLEEVRLEAGASQSVRLPVEAIANGSTKVDVTVLSPGGAELGSAPPFDVQVRAEWEGAVVGVSAAALAVLFVVGLIRAVRRGRRGADGIAPDAPRPGDPPITPELDELERTS